MTKYEPSQSKGTSHRGKRLNILMPSTLKPGVRGHYK